jgi:hypothetical protein
MRHWHDYHLTGYAVDGAERRICLDVYWPYETKTDVHRARLIFSGVEGYFFEHDLGGNILYSIEEDSVASFVQRNAEWFQRERKWGWPLFWKDSVESTKKYIEERCGKVFDISTSYGLSGWILAQSIDEQIIES